MGALLNCARAHRDAPSLPEQTHTQATNANADERPTATRRRLLLVGADSLPLRRWSYGSLVHVTRRPRVDDESQPDCNRSEARGTALEAAIISPEGVVAMSWPSASDGLPVIAGCLSALPADLTPHCASTRAALRTNTSAAYIVTRPRIP
eukprot:COSAG02_NODE_5763_length_4059_cov_5.780808_2_plen_150_part_00